MIKVLQVISDTNIGGAGKWLLNFLKYVDEKTFLIKVALPKGSKLIDEVSKMGVEVIVVNGMNDKSFDIKSLWFFLIHFSKNDYDIVHTHASISARLAAKITNTGKIVFSKHCMDNSRKSIRSVISTNINNRLCHKAIAVAQACKPIMVDRGFKENKIEIIPNGVEKLIKISKEEKESIRHKYSIKKDQIVIGKFGRLEKVKGHIYFIEAAKTIIQSFDNVKFLIVGTGSLEEELKLKVNEYGLSHQIIFTGFVNDVSRLMNITDINVVSSYSEALSLSIIEAMSLGKPCVVTETGGNPELVKNNVNGFLVPVSDHKKLALAIIKLIEDEELRHQMGCSGKEIMESNYCIEKMVDTVEKLYKSIMLRKDGR